MNDREKIIAALENCSDPAGKCRDCPYEECESFDKSTSEYPDELIRKAVELLKKSEPVGATSYGWICPKCGSVYGPNISHCWHCTPLIQLTCTY